MCDCYNHKCKFCENELSIHIADYCTGRDNIIVVCPDCLKRRRVIAISKYARLYINWIEDRMQLFGKLADGRYKGKIVLIFCKDPEGYGIHLN